MKYKLCNFGDSADELNIIIFILYNFKLLLHRIKMNNKIHGNYFKISLLRMTLNST